MNGEPERATGRTGPRPLGLHLATAALTWQSSLAVSPLWRNGSLAWSPMLREAAAALAREAADLPADAVAAATAREVERRFVALIRSIATYHAHPWRRTLAEPPAVWRQGTTRLLDYGTVVPGGEAGMPLLVVPSLVNRYHVLDITAERSLLRRLVALGIRPFVIDWDAPGEAERGFDLTDYVAGRLEDALDAVRAVSGRPPALLGYCMGGLLALALAVRRRSDLTALALLATPFDFHAERPEHARLVGAALGALGPTLAAEGELSVDAIQTLFYSLDPFLVIRKFLAFGRLDPASPEAAHFVALEDWLNDGVPLAGPVARTGLGEWYGQNTPALGRWRIAGRTVDPAVLDLPTLVIAPSRDRLVPPRSATALARVVPGAVRRQPSVGHIGMVAGGSAHAKVVNPLARWLRDAR